MWFPVTRALGATGFASAVTGAFDVRIILTEEPAAFDASHILVENGTNSAPVAGLPIDGGVDENTGARTSTSGDLTALYAGGGYVNEASVPTNTLLPNTTGRDNKYHQYLVTITPTPGFVGDVTVSVAEFDDMEKPVANTYVPLVKSQRLNTETDAGRDLRITEGREVLTVEANAAADTNITAATAAYDARQLIYDAISNEYTLPQKLVIPAGGYLVLVGDRGKAFIADPAATTKTKLNAAQKLFNATGLGLGFPADDLDNFFRNGGSLSFGLPRHHGGYRQWTR